MNDTPPAGNGTTPGARPAIELVYESDKDTVVLKQHSAAGLTVVGGLEVRMPARNFLHAAAQIQIARIEAEFKAEAALHAKTAATIKGPRLHG